MLVNGTGRIEMPELGGDHPHSWRRLGALVMRTAKQAIALGRIPSSAGSVSEWQMNAMSDGAMACRKDVAVARFGKDIRRLAANEFDCSTAPPGSQRVRLFHRSSGQPG
jgi:hypothetical protein